MTYYHIQYNEKQICIVWCKYFHQNIYVSLCV